MVIKSKEANSSVVEKNKKGKGVTKMKGKLSNKTKKSNLKGIAQMGKNFREKAVVYYTITNEGLKDSYIRHNKELLAFNYAKEHNLEIVKTWKGVITTWSKCERKHFSQMLNYVKNHPEIEHIILDYWDIRRTDIEKFKIKYFISDCGKTFHFIDTNNMHNKQYSPADNFFWAMEYILIKNISNDIYEKKILSMEQKAADGIYPGQKLPIGYIKNKETKTIDVDNKTAPIIHSLFKNILEKKNLTRDDLKKMAIQLELRPKKLYSILSNPFYYGYFSWKWHLYPGRYIPLVSKEDWLRVNKKIKKLK